VFGEIINGTMRLNDAGQMSQTVWDELPVFYSSVDIDTFIVMPNHIHGIIVLTWPEIPSPFVGASPRACPDMGQPTIIRTTTQGWSAQRTDMWGCVTYQRAGTGGCPYNWAIAIIGTTMGGCPYKTRRL
ncbi:MAG: hypothetical protein ABIJ30_05125, partial [bacterium]